MTRIIDFSTNYAGCYASRLLADQGFEVVAVELPEGSAAAAEVEAREIRSIPLDSVARHLGRGKAHRSLDFTEQRDEATRLIASADIVLHSLPADLAARFGLDPDGVRAINPAALLVTVTAYGHAATDPGRKATEKTLYADGGAMLIAGTPGDTRAPFAPNAPVVSTIGGIYAAMTILAETMRVRRDGAAFAHLDIALRDLVPMGLERVLPFYSYMNVVPFRGSRRERMQLMAGMGDFVAKDGLFHVFAIKDSFRQLAQLLRRPDLLEDPDWLHPHKREMTPEQVDGIVAADVAQLTVEELATRSRELGLPSGVIVEVDQLHGRAQLQHRQALGVEDDGSIRIEEPYRFLRGSDGAVSAEAAAPNAAADPARPPLDGIRILDLTHAYAGPSATRILSDLGAEVIKVESITRLDTGPRGLLPFGNQPSERWWERAGYFAERNMNKKSVTLDLTSDEGRAVLVDLIGQCDVIASNFTPRVMRGWGLSPEQLLEINPRIVALAMSGFGGTGPDAERPALAGLIEASSGFTSIVRYSDTERPADIGFSFGDMVSGLYAALSVLIALERRDRTGQGDGIDFSCAEAPLPFLVAQLHDWARTQAKPSVATEIVAGGRHIIMRASDGDAPERWAIVFVEDGADERLAETLGADIPATSEPGSWIDVAVPRDALVARLRDAGYAAAALVTSEDLIFDPELRAREVFTTATRRSVGTLPHSRAFPVLRNGAPVGVPLNGAPGLGDDNDEILGGLAGLDAATIAEWQTRGLIGTAPVAIVPKMLTMPVPLGELERRGRVKRAPDAAQRLADAFGYDLDETTA